MLHRSEVSFVPSASQLWNVGRRAPINRETDSCQGKLEDGGTNRRSGDGLSTPTLPSLKGGCTGSHLWRELESGGKAWCFQNEPLCLLWKTSSQPGSQKDAELNVTGADNADGICLLTTCNSSHVICRLCGNPQTFSLNLPTRLFFPELLRCLFLSPFWGR